MPSYCIMSNCANRQLFQLSAFFWQVVWEFLDFTMAVHNCDISFFIPPWITVENWRIIKWSMLSIAVIVDFRFLLVVQSYCNMLYCAGWKKFPIFTLVMRTSNFNILFSFLHYEQKTIENDRVSHSLLYCASKCYTSNNISILVKKFKQWKWIHMVFSIVTIWSHVIFKWTIQ